MAKIESIKNENGALSFTVSETIKVGDRVCTMNYKDKTNPVPEIGTVVEIYPNTDLRVAMDDGSDGVVPAYNTIKIYMFKAGN
jgi:hypothetical protein